MAKVKVNKPTSVRVKAVIFLPGDPSVGIPDDKIDLDFGTWTSYESFFDGMGGRDGHRKVMKEFGEAHAECGPCGVGVVYGDEGGY